MSIFLSSGEVSGDHYVACVAHELRKQGFEGELWGMVGPEARLAGVTAEWAGEQLQLLGLVEVLRAVPSLWRLRDEIAARVMQQNPRIVVVVDSPDFHLPLIGKLRALGYPGRIAYISPPSVWAWRQGRAQKLKKWVDLCLPLFSFEHDFLLKCGCPSSWGGHPLVEEFATQSPTDDAIEGLRSHGKVVALLPGSRGSEIRMLVPLLKSVYEQLENAGYYPVFSVAPGLKESSRALLLDEIKDTYRHYAGAGRTLMGISEAVVGSSGTATIESLLLQKYMVIVYKVHPLTAWMGRLLIRTPFFGLPNLLAGEELFPEFVQEKAEPGGVFKALLAWLEASPQQRETTEKRMSELVLKMGQPGVYQRWAEQLLFLQEGRHEAV